MIVGWSITMKIYLYLNDKIINFSLPGQIEGSFSFDYNMNEESKLINIEARDGNWVIYSTKNTKLILKEGHPTKYLTSPQNCQGPQTQGKYEKLSQPRGV